MLCKGPISSRGMHASDLRITHGGGMEKPRRTCCLTSMRNCSLTHLRKENMLRSFSPSVNANLRHEGATDKPRAALNREAVVLGNKRVLRFNRFSRLTAQCARNAPLALDCGGDKGTKCLLSLGLKYLLIDVRHCASTRLNVVFQFKLKQFPSLQNSR